MMAPDDELLIGGDLNPRRFPNLCAVLSGCVAGPPSDWPGVRAELRTLVKCLVQDRSALQWEWPKDTTPAEIQRAIRDGFALMGPNLLLDEAVRLYNELSTYRAQSGGGHSEESRLVPVEPTSEMIEAALRQPSEAHDDALDGTAEQVVRIIYRAMLAAAPLREGGAKP